MTEQADSHTATAEAPEGAVLPPTNTGPAEERSPSEDARPVKVNDYTSYVHVGPGAEECEHGEDGKCAVVDHFHAWCRLPNPFERNDLREHGEAASARMRRTLADEDSNARVILDGELEGLKHLGDMEMLLTQALAPHFLNDQIGAIREVEEDHPEYKHIDTDKARLDVLEAMNEAERPEDEYTTLRKTVQDHTAAVNKARGEIEAPRKKSLEEKGLDGVVEIIRDQRIDNLATRAHNEEYARWEWYICCFKPKAPDKPGFPNERSFGSIEQFRMQPGEIIEAVAETVTRLERDGQVNLKSS